ncbi:MAG: hypothetical protein ABIG60_05805 [Patescibacteria group bacterium]
MNKQNINNLEIDLEKKYQKRDKRKKPKMKVSGAGVKELQKIIIKK